MKVNLYIERLVLEGIDIGPAQRQVFEVVLEAELGKLLAEGGLSTGLSGGIAVPSVRAYGFQMKGGSDPVRLGQQVAKSVYGGIGK
jgi:hypothetical protein